MQIKCLHNMVQSYLLHADLPIYWSADHKAVWIIFSFLHPDEIPPWMSSPELLALQHNLTFPESATASPIVRRMHRCRRFSVDLSMNILSCPTSLLFVMKKLAFSSHLLFSLSCHVFVIYIFFIFFFQTSKLGMLIFWQTLGMCLTHCAWSNRG